MSKMGKMDASLLTFLSEDNESENINLTKFNVFLASNSPPI